MDIYRAYAYAVYPQKNVSPMRAPEGGAIKVSTALSDVILDNLKEAQFQSRPSVVFNVDTTTRTCDVRDSLLQFAFGNGSQARAACSFLAGRLGAAMDQRSTPALLLVVAFGSEKTRRTVIWIFPNEEAFQLRRGTAEPTIEVLTDVFSRRSKLRKAAMFEGGSSRSDYLEGRILDLQAGSRKQDVAEFFIGAFLDCALSITSDIGSRILAETIREVHGRLDLPEEREQLHGAIIAIRNAPDKRTSILSFAERYLEEPLREKFLDYAPNHETATTTFTFARSSFDEVLQFRVFQLENGLFVYSPLSEVGRGVRVTEGRLVCEGTIEREKLRTKHA